MGRVRQGSVLTRRKRFLSNLTDVRLNSFHRPVSWDDVYGAAHFRGFLQEAVAKPLPIGRSPAFNPVELSSQPGQCGRGLHVEQKGAIRQ